MYLYLDVNEFTLVFNIQFIINLLRHVNLMHLLISYATFHEKLFEIVYTE